MKTSLITLWAILATFGLSLESLPAASRDADWKKVDDAISKGLPKTAIEALDPIIAGAVKDKAWGEAAKAIARKIVLEGNIQGNKPEEKIARLEAEIAKAPKDVMPLLHTIQANWYWHYFQNNRWRFMRRTATAQAPGKDFTTWDLPRLFTEIDKQFTKALTGADTLKKIPIASFGELLPAGTVPDNYRPTLYDFIANEALKFYTSGEQAAAKPQDAFEISADDPLLGPVQEFLKWEVARTSLPAGWAGMQPLPGAGAGREGVTDTDSPKLKAIALFQELLRVHEKDKDPSAFIDADLARLVYGNNVAFGENKSARYKAVLQALADQWADHELSALATHHWAKAVQQEGDLVEARQLAQRGAGAFRESAGGHMCRNLIMEIEGKSASVTTERVWNCQSRTGVPPVPDGASPPPADQKRRDACPTLAVRYRNLTQIYFRAVSWDWNVFLSRRHSRPENLNEQERKELLAKAPALAWSAPLPPTPNYKERVEELPAPVTLKPGFYFLIASHNQDFSDTDNQVTFTDVWVSDLALVVRPHDSKIEGFVLEANSGEPMPGAEVMAWYLDNNGNRVANGPAALTDENGLFSIPAKEGRGSLLRVRHKAGDVLQELGSMQDYYTYPVREAGPNLQTIFFTDRALYRPGQTIQYKGICLHVDAEKDDYHVLNGNRLTVIFADPNGKEIAKAEHRCNDYGSFTGSFTAPRDRVMGRMQIYVTSGPSGSTQFSVEEYKRPKFQVTLEAPKVAAKLGDKVSLQGKAESYTGAAVDGATVKYRVVREVRWPYWWGWYYSWRSPRTQGSQEIAHGAARTETDGTFKIEFLARPDSTVSAKDEASFNFSVYADVTDSSGETRSAERAIHVGFTALQATLTASDWQTEASPVELNIKTTTLDGEAQTAEGVVKIYRLKEPAQVQRSSLSGGYNRWGGEPVETKPDLSNPNNWELADVAVEKSFKTDAAGDAKLEFRLSGGVYRAMLETQDRFGQKVTARLPVQVLKPGDTRFAIKVPHLLAAPKWSLEPGEEFLALWGTGYEVGRAFIEIEHRQKMVERYWTKPGQSQQEIKREVTERMRGGFTLHVTQVRENRAYLASRHIDVPWSNKNLELKWEHFVSKLQPAQKETWTAVITGPGAQKAVAEMAAALYDESLDQYLRHAWTQRLGFFRQDYANRNADFVNVTKGFQHLQGYWAQNYLGVDRRYREFPADLVANFWGYQWARGDRMRLGAQVNAFESNTAALGVMDAAMPAAAPPAQEAAAGSFAGAEMRLAKAVRDEERAGEAPPKGPDLAQVTARKNLNETAFFFPQLISDQDGVVKLQFTMPEALTQWKFLGFAHDRDCRSGFLEGHTVTAKDLMVQPNPPRFLREGDVLEFTVKVSNQTAARQNGKVRLSFDDALQAQSSQGQAGRLSSVDKLLSNTSPEMAFDIPAKESRSYSWRIQVPDGAPFLTYKAVGSTGKVSDGEEGYLPVLSRRIFVTESLPLPIRGPATKKFEFTKLLQSGKSRSLVHQNLVVQMVSNPSWYAVLALPYLMEFPHECTEQTFNRFYANALARNIANSDPKIRKVFDQWKGTSSLNSPLEKNQELKSVLIEETPWLRQANSESQARQNVGILFDDNRLSYETGRTLQKLVEMQLPDGAWPWFPGGRGNDYITLYISTGFGRLRHLGVDLDVAAALKSLNRLDTWMDEHYREILKWPKPENYVPSATDALYLYGRSFFLKDKPVAALHKPAVEFFLARARDHWLKVANRQSQGHLALALRRFNASNAIDDKTPKDIMKSIKERSVTNEEMGMFWRETELSWWWYRAPIETQALMIEAFDEVMGDAQAVEECRVWLLKQKQTQDWKTTKATADAVYALLLRGKDILASDALVEVQLGGMDVTPKRPLTPALSPARNGGEGARRAGEGEQVRAVEAGTGFYERRFAAADIKPKLGEITVKKTDAGVAWGSMHWQYLEDMSQVTPHEGTPLKLKKSLYTKVATKKGQVLEPLKGPLNVGDELVVRLELRVDRDMEYIHLKDQRGSGTEPVNVLSQYKYQDGLAYYESTRDTASHFFIDYLPKGVYVFEYSTRIQHRGRYQTGLAEIQCMYAPEFNSHSESHALVVN